MSLDQTVIRKTLNCLFLPTTLVPNVNAGKTQWRRMPPEGTVRSLCGIQLSCVELQEKILGTKALQKSNIDEYFADVVNGFASFLKYVE